MSHNPREHEDEDAQLDEEDIVEVHEDDGDEPMDEDDDGNDGQGYDGEIVIGAPTAAEEEELMREIRNEDTSWGASGKPTR